MRPKPVKNGKKRQIRQERLHSCFCRLILATMEHNKMVIAVVKEMDADDLLELIVLAKTGRCYERPLRARTVFRARKHLEALIENINQVMNHKDLG